MSWVGRLFDERDTLVRMVALDLSGVCYLVLGTQAGRPATATQWILGIRPTHRGLEIAPVVPADWKAFKASRIYRGARYVIRAKRVGAGHAVRLEVDGRPVKGRVVPLPPSGTAEVAVEVSIGKP